MLPVFVINLASSEQRRTKLTKRLNALDVEFELFEAVDGREKPHPLFNLYNSKRCQRHRRKPMSGGELGCFASHYLLWQKCIELDQPIVVMEDDVYVTGAFVEAVKTAERLIDRLRYIRLAGTSLHRRPYKVVAHVDGLDVVDHIRGPSGTLCYVLHPSAAKDLIKNAGCWYIAVDDYMDNYWRHGVDCFSLMPYSVLVADNNSDIQRLPKVRVSVWIKLKQEIVGRIERILRALYRARRSQKGYLYE